MAARGTEKYEWTVDRLTNDVVPELKSAILELKKYTEVIEKTHESRISKLEKDVTIMTTQSKFEGVNYKTLQRIVTAVVLGFVLAGLFLVSIIFNLK